MIGMDKQEKLLRDILREQKETNKLLKRMDRPVIKISEMDAFHEALERLDTGESEATEEYNKDMGYRPR